MRQANALSPLVRRPSCGGRDRTFQTTLRTLCAAIAVCGAAPTGAFEATAPLLIVEAGRPLAQIMIAQDASQAEQAAARDLQKYIEMISGARTPIVTAGVKESGGPTIWLGEAGLERRPELRRRLAATAKANPVLRADAIVLERIGDAIYLVGSNERSHYFAASELLRRWGVRWFMPGDFGESIPEQQRLEIGDLDYAYAPPFEVRTFWVSWNGSGQGVAEFQLRNMMTPREELPPTGHSLGQYVEDLSASGAKPAWTSMATAEHVARQVEKDFAAGRNLSLGMEDRLYAASAPEDAPLARLQWDKYMLRWSITDPMLTFYNNVAEILQAKHPDSHARIGFLAYSNMTLPPVKEIKAERSLYAELAPIDIDPIHGMDDPDSPPRREYKEMMYRWATVMDGRVAIYDYDQGMLVWRDLPNPSHMAFQQDVQHYRRAGILGVNTETRMALATTFTNLYLRARLLWNPEEDVEALLDDFYVRFYGPAAVPMKEYWSRIFEAWETTIATEHEHFVAPAIYTRRLAAEIEPHLRAAEAAVAPLRQKRELSRNEELYLERLRFTRLGYEVIENHVAMTEAAASNANYRVAVEKGRAGLRARDALTAMNPAFTATTLETGYAFWPGEVQQYAELLPYTNGEKGELVRLLPLEWAFRRDPQGFGYAIGLHKDPVDLTFWAANKDKYDISSRKDYPVSEWEMLRTDVYVQAQGVRHPDRQSFTGDIWYRTELELSSADAAHPLRVRFPGLFNICNLFLNGELIGRRQHKPLWWYNDYRFEWDVPLKGARAGANDLALQCGVAHHFGGMFRRPFVYAPLAAQ